MISKRSKVFATVVVVLCGIIFWAQDMGTFGNSTPFEKSGEEEIAC